MWYKHKIKKKKKEKGEDKKIKRLALEMAKSLFADDWCYDDKLYKWILQYKIS